MKACFTNFLFNELIYTLINAEKGKNPKSKINILSPPWASITLVKQVSGYAARTWIKKILKLEKLLIWEHVINY